MAVDPGLRQAYVVSQDSTAPYPVTVSVIDTRTQAVTATIAVDDMHVLNPQTITVDPATHLVYLIGQGPAGMLSVIDPATNSVTARIPTEGTHDYAAITIDSDRHTAYVANHYFRTVLAIDIRSQTVVATIPVAA